MDLEIGSNRYRNTDGTIEVEGVPQITLGLKKPGGPIQLGFAMFDEGGRLTAKVVDSTLAFNERREMELVKTPTSVALRKAQGGKVVLQVDLTGPDRLAIRKAEFITPKGHTMRVSEEEWRMDKQRMAKGDNDVKGGSVAIG